MHGALRPGDGLLAKAETVGAHGPNERSPNSRRFRLTRNAVDGGRGGRAASKLVELVDDTDAQTAHRAAVADDRTNAGHVICTDENDTPAVRLDAGPCDQAADGGLWM